MLEAERPSIIHFMLDEEESRELSELMGKLEVSDQKELYHDLGLGFIQWALDRIALGLEIGAYDESTGTVTLLNLEEFERFRERLKGEHPNGCND